MKLLQRGLSRLILHVVRFLLLPAELVAARLYMRVYLYILRHYGLRTTGVPRYISSSAWFDDFDQISLGERVVLSKHVTLLTHDYSLTTALHAIGEQPPTDIKVTRPIHIGDNVFVGMGSTLLPGTSIGDNVIVGAGSVVRGTIPSDSVVVGNPARVTGSISSQADRWRALSAGDLASADES